MAKGGNFGDQKQKTVYEEAPAGNAVNLEEQMVKVADTQMDYETMTTLYQRSIGMIRTALGKGR
jgi:flagellar basal-body rod protein FlgB